MIFILSVNTKSKSYFEFFLVTLIKKLRHILKGKICYQKNTRKRDKLFII